MNPIIRHFGKVLDNGNISFYNEELWENQRLSLRGCEFELVIKKKLRKPSPDQFGYMFGGILGTMLTCEQFSHYNDPKELFYDVFSPLFLSYNVMVRVGKKSWLKTRERPLSDLNKAEISDLIEKMLIYCAQEGIEVLPADQYVNKHYRTEEK